ncbi:MAG: hypothetical protein ACI4Q4_05945 [Oscillospiraceae bacterium]
MLKKGERICPVCGKKLRQRAPSNRDADGKDIREGYPCGAVRTHWSIMPYTIYPHREHRIVRAKGGIPHYTSANFIERELRSDGLSLFNPFLVFFCEECGSRLSLNFKAIPHNYCRSIAPQIFRQIVLKRRRRASARQGVLVQYDGKYASKRTAKAQAGNCAVLP